MRSILFGLALAAVGAAGAGPARAEEHALRIPSFVEETASSGISSSYDGEWEFMVGGGAAAFDCNDDGFADLLLAGGTSPAKFYRNASTRGGALRFTAETSGLELDQVTGAYPIDIDSDGFTDLVLLRVGENVVMRGRGDCRFERANEAWGFDGGDAWSTALAATWERGAAWPTLAVGNYIDRTQDTSPWGSCTDNWLHRPKEDVNAFAPPLALKPSYCALSMLFTDWNRSGTPSLRISNDREYYEGGQEQMWRVERGKAPALYTDADGWKLLRIWGMGIASTDLDGDGYPEYFLTSMSDNKLQALAAPKDTPLKPSYNDVAYAKGVTAYRPYTGGDWHPSTAWHAEFQDINNDGLADLFVAKGNVAKMPDFAMKDPNNLLLQTGDGKFVEAGDKAGIVSFANHRGAALVDFNLDGLLDLVVVNRWENAQIWRNISRNAGRSLDVRLEQPPPNRDGIGARVEVRCEGEMVMRHEVTVGGGHAGGQLGWQHFGLADVKRADLRVIWPDGTTGEWQPVESGRFYELERGKQPRAWEPK
jgi:enediyne biosynthesis protein E4